MLCWFLNYRCPQLVNASQPAGAKTVRKLWDLPMVLSAIPRTGVSHSDQVSPQQFEVWLDKSYFLFPHDNTSLIFSSQDPLPVLEEMGLSWL